MKNQREVLDAIKGNSVTVTKTNANGEKTSQTKQAINANEFILSDAIKEAIGKTNVSAKVNSLIGKDRIYNYPTDCVSISDQKTFRRKMRLQTDNFLIGIISAAKHEPSKLQAVIESFLTYYRTNFKTQNFEITSVSQSQKSEQVKNYTIAMNIVKQYVSRS